MQFAPNNPIIRLCARGMKLEGADEASQARQVFYDAWDSAGTAMEKYVTAHYVARHQDSVEAKLEWDELALVFARELKEESIYSSLYLNIAKCFEDLDNMDEAKKNYGLALSYAYALPAGGYGEMIKAGIENGIKGMGI